MSEKWCGGGDLNPYARRYQILSLARLPFRHLRIDNIVAYSQTTGPTRSRRERGVRSVGCVGGKRGTLPGGPSPTTGPTRSRRERGVRSVGCVGRSQSGRILRR